MTGTLGGTVVAGNGLCANIAMIYAINEVTKKKHAYLLEAASIASATTYRNEWCPRIHPSSTGGNIFHRKEEHKASK